jgi:hypothetical protein
VGQSTMTSLETPALSRTSTMKGPAMPFKALAAFVLATLLSSCCCFGGSVDESDDIDVPFDQFHNEGAGQGV